MVRHTGKDFINVKRITVTAVLSLQSACIYGTELDTPKTDCLSTDDNASLGE